MIKALEEQSVMCWNIDCENVWIDEGWRVGFDDMCLLDRGDEVPVRVARRSDVEQKVDSVNDENLQTYFEGLGNVSKFTEEMVHTLLTDI